MSHYPEKNKNKYQKRFESAMGMLKKMSSSMFQWLKVFLSDMPTYVFDY